MAIEYRCLTDRQISNIRTFLEIPYTLMRIKRRASKEPTSEVYDIETIDGLPGLFLRLFGVKDTATLRLEPESRRAIIEGTPYAEADLNTALGL